LNKECSCIAGGWTPNIPDIVGEREFEGEGAVCGRVIEPVDVDLGRKVVVGEAIIEGRNEETIVAWGEGVVGRDDCFIAERSWSMPELVGL
jgi:hypothetical protein